VTIRSPDALRQLLDFICSGLSWKDSMAGIGARSEGAGWEWKRQSRLAEQAGDTSSIFYLDWPLGSEPDYLHNLLDKARDRRGVIVAALRRIGETGQIVDGRLAFERDDFGGLVLDDHGLPTVERVTIVAPPNKGMHRPNPDEVREAMCPRRELKPSSYSGHKPREVPAPTHVGNALSDYIRGSNMTDITKQPMTALERDLREKLAAGPKNSKPSAPVHIIRDQADDARHERINQPSNETGLPRTAEVNRTPSRPAYAKPRPLDGARVPPSAPVASSS